MQDYFNCLADSVNSLLQAKERFTLSYAGECSDFIRFNRSRVRQAGQVVQHRVRLRIIHGKRHATGRTSLSGLPSTDRGPLETLVRNLRDTLEQVPEDPHLHYATDVFNSEAISPNRLPNPHEVLEQILHAGKGKDLVGIYAAGAIYHGFANSFGQRNWFSNFNFNFDWSLFLEADKAVKCDYAGSEWDPGEFKRRVKRAVEHLGALSRPARGIDPGQYRVYLAPAALTEVLTMLCWGGFGLKSKATKQTPLIKMVNQEVKLHDSITLRENIRDGVSPNFDVNGFIKPDRVVLLDKGCLKDPLISPRSAKEYGVPTNGAEASEFPVALDLDSGNLDADHILTELDTGIYVSNLWYLNYSDRRNCRMTGMTRFATFWVDHGELVAPLNVMRFDESAYRMLGSNLLGLTRQRDFVLDPDTYEQRSTSSMRVPGALVDHFTFTL